MPIVPFSQRPAQLAIPASMMPDETHLDMAAASMLSEVPAMDKSSHEATSKRLDKEMSGEEPDLSHAEVKSGDEWNQIVQYKGRYIDPTKLSPKELKATGIKY